jgi:hypothetical protein
MTSAVALKISPPMSTVTYTRKKGGREGGREGRRIRKAKQSGAVRKREGGREGGRKHSPRFFGLWRRRSSRLGSAGRPARRFSEGGEGGEGEREGGRKGGREAMRFILLERPNKNNGTGKKQVVK